MSDSSFDLSSFFTGKNLSGLSGAASDLFNAFGSKMADDLKAEGLDAEGKNYGMAVTLAEENKQYTIEATDVKDTMAKRQQELGIGQETTNLAGNGFTMSGSSLDILRSAHQQAGLETAMTQTQGSMTEIGYQEQADSYRVMQQYATDAANSERKLGSLSEIAGIVGSGLKIASLFL
jgi:hypothetical protein